MGLNKRRGISNVTALIIIIVVASTLTVSLGYWSGIFNYNPPQNFEYLELTNATIWDLGGNNALKFLVKNTGTKDARIEYIVFNGDIIPYASKIFGEWISYNFMEGEYLIIPYNSQVEMYIPYETNKESLEIRLHTQAGNDFTKALLASSLQTEYEESPYTKFEQIEIQSAVCYKDVTVPANYFWKITMTLKNTGTRDATLISAFINEVEVDSYGVTTYTGTESNWATSMTETTYLTSGASTTVNFYIDPDKADASLSSGTTINIKIHSSGGMDYPKLVGLT